MSEIKNILTVCAYGHSRSVAMARCLQGKGYKATAMGILTAGPFLSVACEMADTIFVMERGLISGIPQEYHSKVVFTDVGHDRWVNPYHPELQGVCDRLSDNVLASPGVSAAWNPATNGIDRI